MFVLFAAMLVYLGVYLFRSTQQSYATAPAVLVTVSESGQASGIVVREEQVIASDKEFLSLSVDDGKEVASGGEIAIGVDSKAAHDSASRARELKKEIAYVSSLLSRAGSASGASDRDSDVRSAILQLNAAVSAGSTSELDDLCMDLSSLLFGSATGTVSQGDLDALNAELHQLENAGAGRGSITAPAAGLFTSTTDGYESLTPDMLENLTPDGVDALERTTPATPANAIGKLVTAKKWYFASVMNKADADRLNLNGLALSINSLALKARNNKLTPDEISGGTFTITNYGTFKMLFGTPVINQPEVAILGVGSIEKKPVVKETPEGDVIAIRHKMYLSLSYDHRVVDGSLGGNFLHFIADYLERFTSE